MTYSGITRLRKISPVVESLISNVDRYLFVDEISVEEQSDGTLKLQVEPDIRRILEGSEESRRLKCIYVKDLTIIIIHFEEKVLEFLNSIRIPMIYCILRLEVSDDTEAFDFVRLVQPEEVYINYIFQYSRDFLANPAFKNVREVFMEAEDTRISFALHGSNLRKFDIASRFFFEDEIMEFVERFLEGKQIIRQFCCSKIDAQFREKFISKFSENMIQEKNGFLRIFNAKEEAFVLINKERFFFRFVKKINGYILDDYFSMMPFCQTNTEKTQKEQGCLWPEIDYDDDSYYFDEANEDPNAPRYKIA